MQLAIEPMTEWRDRQFVTRVYASCRFGYFQYVRFLDLIRGTSRYTVAWQLGWRRSNIPRA